MSKLIRFDQEARRGLESGVNQLTRAVRITLGPKGRNVVLAGRFGGPTITNDGVTIAKEVELDDPWENLGATLVREAATKTNDVAGDGTTTATVLAHSMITDGIRNIVAGSNPLELKRGIEKAVKAAVGAVKKEARDVEDERDVAYVAAISANNDNAIGDIVGEAIHRVGKDGVITVEESNRFGMELELVDGTRFDKGYISPYFVTDNERMEVVYDDAYILVSQAKISSVRDLLPILEKVMQTGKPLLIIAEDLEGEALSTLVVNKLRGTFSACAVKGPGFGERRKSMLEDLAILTGGEVVADERGIQLENVTLDMLGKARRVKITKDDTTIIDGDGDAAEIKTRIDQIRAQIANAVSDWDREKLQERMAKLAGGVAVLKVGAATELELKEKKHRIEDSVSATKAALEEGVVAGGGSTLVRARSTVEALGLQGDEAIGAAIVTRALSRPLWWIAHNAGYEGGTLLEQVASADAGHGLNAATGEFGDLFKQGVIDPVRVTRAALENAGSVAGMLLTTEVAVVEKPEEEQGNSHGHSHGHQHHPGGF